MIVSVAFVFSGMEKSTAQFVNDGIYVKENAPGRKPLPYPYLREADVYWQKRIWRIIDLREKMNHPLYYPTTPIGGRLSLFDLILWGVKNAGLQVYSADDDEFKVPVGYNYIESQFGAGTDTIEITNSQTGEIIRKVVEKGINSDEVKQYLIKEDWYFDRKYSMMKVRIIGICPIRITEEDVNGVITQRKKLTFWIYFDEARRIFANNEVYNPKNEAQRLTFDDYFQQRLFSSYIFKESNVYNNRIITQYANGIYSLYESDRIKNEIANIEQDMWEY